VAFYLNPLFITGGKLSSINFIGKSLIGLQVRYKVRPNAFEQVSNHATKDRGSSGIEMGSIAAGEIVIVRIRRTDGVDVVGALLVEVDVLDTDSLCSRDGGRGMFSQVLDNSTAAKGAARKGRRNDLCILINPWLSFNL
jgi:hypothetical protein